MSINLKNIDDETLYNTQEVKELLGLKSEKSIWNYVADNKLIPVVRQSKKFLFLGSEIKKCILKRASDLNNKEVQEVINHRVANAKYVLTMDKKEFNELNEVVALAIDMYNLINDYNNRIIMKEAYQKMNKGLIEEQFKFIEETGMKAFNFRERLSRLEYCTLYPLRNDLVTREEYDKLKNE